jgi:hypothetical protein
MSLLYFSGPHRFAAPGVDGYSGDLIVCPHVG